MMLSRWLKPTILYFTSILFSPAALATDATCSLSASPFLISMGNCTLLANNNYPDGVDSWGVQVGIALPPQYLCVVPSTVVNNTAVMSTEVCQNDNSSTLDQCISRRGGEFNDNGAGSFNASSPQVALAPDPVWNSFNPPFTNAGYTNIEFSADISLSNFPIAIVLNAENSSESQLGLANDSVLLRSIVSAGLSPSRGFGLLAGSQSVLQPRNGHIVFGGYDAASLAGPFVNYSITNATDAGDRVCSLQVTVEELILRRPGFGDVQIVSTGNPMPSCIEPYDNLFRLPEDVLQRFQQITGWTNESSLVPEELYIVEPGLNYNSSFDGSLIFTLNNGFTIEIPNEELAWPLRGINTTGQKVLQSNVTVVNIFNQEAPEYTAVLGKVFLSQVYLAVDYPNEQFQLAPVVVNEVAANLVPFTSSLSIDCPPGSQDNSIIGVIVLGCIIAIILIIFCAYIFIKRRAANNELERKQATENGFQGLNSLGETRDLPDLVTASEARPRMGSELDGDHINAHRPSLISTGGSIPSRQLASPFTPISQIQTDIPQLHGDTASKAELPDQDQSPLSRTQTNLASLLENPVPLPEQANEDPSHSHGGECGSA